MKRNIYVLYGGKSPEHAVSLKTALAVINALDRKKYTVHPVYISRQGVWTCLPPLFQALEALPCPQGSGTPGYSLSRFLQVLTPQDVVFPALHGPNGEDGTLQGLLELLEVAYVGCGVLASALGMDKILMKECFAHWQVPQTQYQAIWEGEWRQGSQQICRQLLLEIGLPCYVKPARMGSSIGISCCQSLAELEAAVEKALGYDEKVIVEREIRGREMQVAVLGNDQPVSSIVGEYIQQKAYMDYEAKYVDQQLIPVLPARISPETAEAMGALASEIFTRMGCSGLLRVDFFVTEEERFYVNEVNTLPGCTDQSLFPRLWEKTKGITYPELMDQLIDLALDRWEQKEKIRGEFEKHDS